MNRSIVISAAIQAYRELLGREPPGTTPGRLLRAAEERELLFNGRPVCHVLRPLLLDAAVYESVRQAATLVARGLRELSRRLATDAVLRRHVALSPEEEQAVELDPGEPTEVVGRLDGFLAPEGRIQFIEYNPVPAGVVNSEELTEIFAAMPIMQELARRFDLRPIPTRGLVCGALLGAYSRRGGTGVPSIAVLDSGGVTGAALQGLLELRKILDLLRAQGCPVQLAGPAQLEYSGGQLRVAGCRTDVIYVVDWPSFLRAVGPEHRFWRAVQERTVWIANSLSASILRGSKSVFALLSDPVYADLFEPAVAAALARHVPWTRRVRQGRTTYHDQSIELVPFMAAHREQLVLKPSDEYGGRGVVLGWECDERDWARALGLALGSPYVVQERVPVGQGLYPIEVDGELQWQEHHFDLDPFVWGEQEVQGCMVRLSRAALMNVSAGSGSHTPMFLVGAADQFDIARFGPDWPAART